MLSQIQQRNPRMPLVAHAMDNKSHSGVAPLDVTVVVVAFHASTHAISLIVTTPAIRQQLVKVYFSVVHF